MPDPAPSPAPYGSAADLPSIADMLEQIHGLKLLTRVVARRHRSSIVALEKQLREHVTAVDTFYELLGPRNWIFHDDLNLSFAKSLILLSEEDAERALIDFYRDPDELRILVRRLGRFPELGVRAPLIERAEADFHAGRHYSTVQLLLSVMDGFVNDIEPANRRGLHARDADEMVAWDSVVGHHMGLAHAHQTFTKTIRKVSTEEVRELYRNGIVHGTLVNYDNEFVSCKSWNRLFAVADWATSRRKQGSKPKARASWRDISRSLERNRQTKRALNQWGPSSLRAGDEGFEVDEVVARSREYLEAWIARNFGRMAALLSPLVSESSEAKTAGAIRSAFASARLTGFQVESVRHSAAAVALVDVVLGQGGDVGVPGRMRWLRSGPDGISVAPNEPGTWGLITWTDTAMKQARGTEARTFDDY